MQLESRKLLADAHEASLAMTQFAVGKTLADINTDALLRSAIYWQFAIIGEALSQLRELDPATLDRISESSRIIGFRHQIIHGYQVIQDNVTWQIVQDKLPVLRRERDTLLSE